MLVHVSLLRALNSFMSMRSADCAMISCQERARTAAAAAGVGIVRCRRWCPGGVAEAWAGQAGQGGRQAVERAERRSEAEAGGQCTGRRDRTVEREGESGGKVKAWVKRR